MKARTIKTVLKKKHAEWVASIADIAVAKLVEDNTIITGGCIASMLLGEAVNDFDVYFTNHATAKAVAQYYVDKFNEVSPGSGVAGDGTRIDAFVSDEEGRVKVLVKSAGVAVEGGDVDTYQYFEGDPDPSAIAASEYIENAADIADKLEDETKPAYRPVFMSANAITLSRKIQVVLRFYGNADEIHANYDFAHCTSYWTSRDGNLVLRPDALEALLARELRYIGSKYPLCSMFRIKKFVARGYSINAGQMLKIAMQISALDLTDIDTLEEQLTGVDAAYFVEVVNKLRDKGGKVDATYLTEIIDRMF